MKKYSKYIFVAVLSLLFASCTQKESVPFLKVDAAALSIEQSGGVSEVAINHNLEDVRAKWIGEAMGQVSIEGNKLIINVSANPSASLRESTIEVSGNNGDIKQFVKITQTAADAVIFCEVDKLVLEEAAGKRILKVSSSLSDWTITHLPGWMTAEEYPKSSELILTWSDNALQYDREDNIEIKAGNTFKRIPVIQKNSYDFTLPYIENVGIFGFGNGNVAKQEIIEFEKNRGSYEVAEGRIYKTKSKAFTKIEYSTSMFKFESAMMYASTPALLRHPEVSKMLVNAGFEFQFTTWDGDLDVYWQPETNAMVFVNYVINGISFLNDGIKPIPFSQFRPYKTFDSFPFEINNWNADKAQIDAYEAANGGGQIITDETSTVTIEGVAVTERLVEYLVNSNDVLIRGYVLRDNKIHEYYTAYKDITKTFFKHMKQGPNGYILAYSPTAEFLTLSSKEMFSLFEIEDLITPGPMYYSPRHKVVMMLLAKTYTFSGNNLDCAEIHFQYDDMNVK